MKKYDHVPITEITISALKTRLHEYGELRKISITEIERLPWVFSTDIYFRGNYFSGEYEAPAP